MIEKEVPELKNRKMHVFSKLMNQPFIQKKIKKLKVCKKWANLYSRNTQNGKVFFGASNGVPKEGTVRAYLVDWFQPMCWGWCWFHPTLLDRFHCPGGRIYAWGLRSWMIYQTSHLHNKSQLFIYNATDEHFQSTKSSYG
jgi:hypothetical protein